MSSVATPAVRENRVFFRVVAYIKPLYVLKTDSLVVVMESLHAVLLSFDFTERL